jgi:hypothetical protein
MLSIKIMKASCLTVCNFLIICFSVFGQEKAEVAPGKFFEKKSIRGAGEYAYFTLSGKAVTSYRLEGPGKFYVNCRIALRNIDSKSKSVSIKVVQSESLIRTYEIPELYADAGKSAEDDFPSKVHRIEIDVPPGKHFYRLYSTDEKQDIYVRGLYTAYPKPVWKDLTPLNNPEKKQIQFAKPEKVQEYYEIKKKDWFQFAVSDSVQVRIIIRPSFDNKMLDDTKISVSLVNKNTGHEQVYRFSSARAKDVVFANDDKSIPGKSAVFYASLPKPKGKSDGYELRFLGGAKAVVVRVSINKRSGV